MQVASWFPARTNRSRYIAGRAETCAPRTSGGGTHDQIAAEKAGIIKPGVPVITAAEPGLGLEVIARVAHENDSPLTVIDRNDARGALLDAAKIPLIGEHQRLNGAVAVAAVRAVEPKIPVPPETILREAACEACRIAASGSQP